MASSLRIVKKSDEPPASVEPVLRRCATCGEPYPAEYVVCPKDATPLGVDAEVEDPLLGAVLAGTYRLERHLGRGGMGRLYEAQHTRLDRVFAVKVLHESHSRNKDALRRFEREARALSRIRSDHVLDVIDLARTADGRTALITARLEGEDLKSRLDRVGKLAAREAVPLARQVCRGLAAAHAQGIVHRDLKPSNLFLERSADGRETVKILDFGVAKLDGEPELTRTGAVVGTPAYMAPEQARGSGDVDERADVYAVGAVLYRMLTGKPPYSGEEPAAVLTSLLSEAPRRPRALEREIPVGLEAVLQRAMARRAEARYPDVLELEHALADYDDSAVATPASARASPSGEASAGRSNASRGSLGRAHAAAKRAAQARPLAVVLAGVVSLGAGALAALLAVGLSTLEATARTPVQVSTSWLLAGGALVGAVSFLVRWLSARWSSAPEVLAANRTLSHGALAGLAGFGLLELALRAHDSLYGIADVPLGWALVGRALFVAALAALAARRAHAHAPSEV